MAIVPHPTTSLDETRLRAVLAAPRGQRFSRPGATIASPRATSTRPQQALYARPKPPQEREQRLPRQGAGDPGAAYRLTHGEQPHRTRVARQQQEQKEKRLRAAGSTPVEPVPAPARGRHRAPRRWWAWPAVAVGAVLLFGLQVGETVSEGFLQGVGILS